MNKKIIKYIEKELAKEKNIVINYEPNLAELEYLTKKNITVKTVTVMRQGFMVDFKYPVELFKYSRI